VDIFSVAYRIPFYDIGDSLDIIYGNSSSNTPIAQATGFNLTGKGSVIGLRWNHYFPRQGEYTSKLIVGLDQKHINTTCTTNGVPTAVDPPGGGGASCTPYTLRPLSVSYAGQKASPGVLLDYSFGASQNLFPLGTFYDYTTLGGATGNDRYTMISGGRQVPNRFVSYKANLSYLKALPDDWTVRAAINAQYSHSPLPGPEQIGLAGSTAVRGFNERAVAMDKGYFANIEVYTPELASHLGVPGSLKFIGFYDFARGYNYGTVRPLPETTPVEKAGIGSLGIGVRYTLARDFSFRADLARVMDAGPVNIKPGTISTTPPNTESRGDWRGHFSLSFVF
jgi:hemolysin activation/secretion protein